MRRFIWILLFLAGLALLTYQLSNNIINYFQYPALTSIETNTGNTLIAFPKIILCNRNPAKWSVIGDFLDYAGKWSAVEWEDNYGDIVSKTHEYEKMFERTYADFNETVKLAMAHSLNETLLSCEFQGQPCDWGHWGYMIVGSYGVCYEYNGFLSTAEIYNVVRNTGPENGLIMKLWLDQDEYIPGLSEISGFHLYVLEHDYAVVPDHATLSISPGMATFVEISKI